MANRFSGPSQYARLRAIIIKETGLGREDRVRIDRSGRAKIAKILNGSDLKFLEPDEFTVYYAPFRRFVRDRRV